jgi:glycosyltransferase involved in cell wall biosynthesis
VINSPSLGLRNKKGKKPYASTGLLERIGDAEVPVLIVNTEQSGMDRYSQELAKRLDVKKITSRRYLSPVEAYKLARSIRSDGDIVHLPNQHFARYALFLKQPFIVTVHDLARCCFNFDSETISEKILLNLDKRYIKRASHIIAISQSTKSDLTKYLRIPETRISVIYNGVDHSIFRPYEPYQMRPYHVMLSHKPYILYVGSERRRKNLGRLFEAFATLRQEFPELKLVKVGGPGSSRQSRSETLKKLSSLGITEDVTFVDYISELELAYYYSSATLLAYPSLYEGFGLPPLEAMACGCPVVTANTSSLPEVVGEAGIMVNPYDTSSLVQAMRRVLTDDKLRNNMVSKGLEQSKKFSWEKTAELTLQVYNKVARGGDLKDMAELALLQETREIERRRS